MLPIHLSGSLRHPNISLLYMEHSYLKISKYFEYLHSQKPCIFSITHIYFSSNTDRVSLWCMFPIWLTLWTYSLGCSSGTPQSSEHETSQSTLAQLCLCMLLHFSGDSDTYSDVRIIALVFLSMQSKTPLEFQNPIYAVPNWSKS